MKHGTYVGPIAHLKGKTALLQPLPTAPWCVRAQFDDRELTMSQKPVPPQEFPGFSLDALGFGWHTFQASDFEEDKP